MTKEPRPKLRTSEAADYLTIGVSTLEKLRAAGGGPIYCKVGKSVVYDPGDLDAWLATNRRNSSSVAA